MIHDMQKPASSKVVQVALKIPFAPFLDYILPDDIEHPIIGARVVVPLGKNKKQVGLVLSFSDSSQHANLKAIEQILDHQPLLSSCHLKLLTQAAKYYQVPLGEMIFTALPSWYKNISNKPIPIQKWWQAIEGSDKAKSDLCNAPKQQQVYEYLKLHGPLKSSQLNHISKSASQICQQLALKGLASSSELCLLENSSAVDPKFTLTTDQSHALKQLKNQTNHLFGVSLLDGITGSGKTEVYIQFINHLLEQQKQVLVLVPEIGLTPQLFQEINQRINAQMAVLHSGLSDGARARVWYHARSGKVDVVVATRSGIFTPFKNLGAILIDEEHDLSYKQQDGIRYSARDLAVLRGQIESIPVVLGSATPSFETLNNAMLGKYNWLKLRSRTNNSPMPSIALQNTQNNPAKQGLSHKTKTAIQNHIEEGNQVLVFLNRRGWSPKLICHECNWVAMCDDCDAYLTFHKHLGLLKCHHCDRHYSLPEFCPQCGSQHVETLGVGTEKIAAGLSETFNQDQVVRFDRDAVKTPAQWQNNLDIVRSGKPCIIVGTQMLSKGHDFPLLSLVVVVNVDNSFFSSDFRATEYLAQLLTQVSGRAGRAKTKGEVIIQTQFPEHEFFQSLFQHGYESFAKQQLAERKQMLFPPYAHMAIIRAQHKNEHLLDQFLHKMSLDCEQSEWVSVMGPLPAPIPKRQSLFRMQLILSANERKHLHQLIHQLKKQHSNTTPNIAWFVDIDPVGFD